MHDERLPAVSKIASMIVLMARRASRRQVSNLCRHSVWRSNCASHLLGADDRFGRVLRLAPVCCSAPCLWRLRHRRAVGQVRRQGRTFADEPADKLYNEGLYLMNKKQGFEGGHEEIRGSRSPASVFRLGAQIAADVGLRLLQGRRLRQLHRRRDALRHAASRQSRRRLCAVSDRGLALRSDPRRLARSGPHRKSDRGAGRGDPQISDLGIRHQRQGEA